MNNQKYGDNNGGNFQRDNQQLSQKLQQNQIGLSITSPNKKLSTNTISQTVSFLREAQLQKSKYLNLETYEHEDDKHQQNRKNMLLNVQSQLRNLLTGGKAENNTEQNISQNLPQITVDVPQTDKTLKTGGKKKKKKKRRAGKKSKKFLKHKEFDSSQIIKTISNQIDRKEQQSPSPEQQIQKQNDQITKFNRIMDSLSQQSQNNQINEEAPPDQKMQMQQFMSHITIIIQDAQEQLQKRKDQSNQQYAILLREAVNNWMQNFKESENQIYDKVLKESVWNYINIVIQQLNTPINANMKAQGLNEKQTQEKLFQDLEIPFQKYWIDTNSKLYQRWTLFILLLNIVWIQAFLPIRMSFENQRSIYFSIALFDLVVDFIYFCECLSFFFIPKISRDGEYIFDRRKVAKEYLQRWFFLDCLANIPYSMFKAFPKKASLDDLTNFFTFNFAYIPRFYIVCLALKLLRIRHIQKYLVMHLKLFRVSINKIHLVLTCWTLILILHMIACFWGVAGKFNISTNVNWIYAQDMQDEDVFYSYLTCLYWASVTIITVGYGDILPVNSWETSLVCVIFVIGVAMFSYTLSALANQFSDLSRSRSKRLNRDKQLFELQHKYKLPQILIQKIQYYFSQTDSVIEFSRDYEMTGLLKVLPPNLKTRLALFLYHDAIKAIPFLQNREQTFYLNFLDQLIPLKFQKGTMILKQGTRPEEILLILQGFVQNDTTQRALGPGSLLGETDYIYRRERAESFVAITDVFILKFEISIFEQILDYFPQIKQEVENIAKKREKMRLLIVRQTSLVEDQEKHKKHIFELLKVHLKTERQEILDLKQAKNSYKRIQSLDVQKLSKNQLINRKTINNKSFSSDRTQQLNNQTNQQKKQKQSSQQTLSYQKLQNNSSNISMSLSNKSGMDMSRGMRSQLEQIDEIMESMASNQKTVSDHDMRNDANDDIFKNQNLVGRKNSTFQLQDIQKRMRELSNRKIDIVNVDKNSNNNSNSGSKMLNEKKVSKNLVNQRIIKIQDQEQEIILTSSSDEIIHKMKIDQNNLSPNSSSRSPQHRVRNSHRNQKFTSQPSSPHSANRIFKKSNKVNRKKHSSMDLRDQNIDSLYESQKSSKLEFLSQQDAFFYSNPQIKMKTLKSKVYDSKEFKQGLLKTEQEIQKPTANLKMQMNKINIMIKKSKLILNEYGNMFSDYLEKLRRDNKNTVSEHILVSTKGAIKGIQKYNQILAFIEQKLEQPQLFTQQLDQFTTTLPPSIEQQLKLKQKLQEILAQQQKTQILNKAKLNQQILPSQVNLEVSERYNKMNDRGRLISRDLSNIKEVEESPDKFFNTSKNESPKDDASLNNQPQKSAYQVAYANQKDSLKLMANNIRDYLNQFYNDSQKPKQDNKGFIQSNRNADKSQYDYSFTGMMDKNPYQYKGLDPNSTGLPTPQLSSLYQSPKASNQNVGDSYNKRFENKIQLPQENRFNQQQRQYEVYQQTPTNQQQIQNQLNQSQNYSKQSNSGQPQGEKNDMYHKLQKLQALKKKKQQQREQDQNDLDPNKIRQILEQNGLNNIGSFNPQYKNQGFNNYPQQQQYQNQNKNEQDVLNHQSSAQIPTNFTINLYNNSQVIYQQNQLLQHSMRY